MWNAQRKEDDGKNEWLSAEEEKELKAKFAAIIANVRTQDTVEHKTGEWRNSCKTVTCNKRG